jgi:hypothetical protein
MVLTNIGEEFFIKNGVVGVTFDVGLFNAATDTITESSDLAAFTTEPSNGNYARMPYTTAPGDVSVISTNYGITISVSFDVTNTTGSVDSAFLVCNFTSDEAGDVSATDHLFGTAPLNITRDLSQNDTLNVDFEFTVD